ncbi:MAG: TonB-dependent receptor domain-containing protein, partial [Candidatus Azotimanducaceae bacterium WSBS_2022_MAG_OTU7]
QFFVNDFDTNTSGIDIVANYPFEWANSSTDVTLAFNLTNTKVTKRGNTIDDGRERELEEAIPEQRATLTFDHNAGPFSALLRINYFGEAYESLFNDGSDPVETDSLFIADAEVSWQFSDTISLALGAKNVFDNYPDQWEIERANGTVTTGRTGGYLGAIYPLNHPVGLGGGRYYLRLTADF